MCIFLCYSLKLAQWVEFPKPVVMSALAIFASQCQYGISSILAPTSGNGQPSKLLGKLFCLAHTRLDMAYTATVAMQFMLDPQKRQIIIQERKEIIHGGVGEIRRKI